MARKGTAKIAGDDEARSNLTPELALEKHMPAIRAAKIAHQLLVDEAATAASLFRATLKAAKKDGIDTDAVTFMLKFEKREKLDQERFVVNFNRIAMFMELPIGTQMGMFDGKSIATAVEDRKIKAAAGEKGDDDVDFDPPGPANGGTLEEAKAYNEGEAAGKGGKNLDTCPYTGTSPKAKRLRAQFETGWADAQAAAALALGKQQTVGAA